MKFHKSSTSMSLMGALDARDMSYVLRTTYNDYLIQFLNNFNDYILEHGEEFLNDASAHYPNDPFTGNVVPLKAHFIDYFKHAPAENGTDLGHADLLMKCIWMMFESVGHYSNFDDSFPTLVSFFEKRGNDSFAFRDDAQRLLALRETLLSWEKLAHIGQNLRSAIHVSEAGN